MKKNNPRLLALRALNEIWRKDKRPREVLDSYAATLDSRDMAFIQELVYGVIRNRLYIDWCLTAYLKDPSGLKYATLNNLRLGVYQAFFMRVPDRAVVFETTEVEKSAGRNTGLVNAVLRKIITGKTCPPLPEDPVERLSILTSHPVWLVRRWIERFGVTEAEALTKANNTVPPLTLRVNTLRTDREKVAARLSEMGIEFKCTDFSPVGIKIQGSYVFRDIEGLLGDVFIQDEAAQLVTYLLQPQEGQAILDACAAPGGKTTHIAELTGDRARVYAVESSAERLGILQENVRRQGLGSVKMICSDIVEFKPPEGFHGILLDAPCSSLGVIRRNPDVRYKHSPEILRRFHEKQVEMLTAVSRHLLPCGILVYSVCSTEPEEGEEVIRSFLHKEREFFIIEDTESLPSTYDKGPAVDNLRELINDEGYFRTYPHRHDMDGFFAVRLSRKEK
ncbi:MAG TPA: 16S rRNA (cytosine(967)-C(5))-methyltransferase RsmB [Nitrospirae bacterium]|nr:16S rRNA (cytosine(967)-C(5))-methyltransferase RsmB [Nitrospirota bacterium]